MDKILLADAINAAGIAALVLDGSDRILGCTDAAGRLLGYNPDQLIGLPITSFLPEYPENGIGLGQTQELTVQSPAGAPLSLDANIVRWTDPAGQNRTTVILREAAVEREVARITQNELIQSDNAIRGANIGVFEYDTATKSVSVSSIWRKMLELEPDETLDLQAEWRSRVHLDDLAEALRPVDLCAAGLAERASCEYRLHARDRTHWRWMRTDIAVARRDRDGKATLLVGAQTDVTDRKAMEEALRISAEQFRSAFENAPIGKAVVALDGSWLRVNPALCTLLGFSEDEFRRTNFQSLTFPDDLEADLSLLRQLVAGEIQSYTMEKRYIRANGAIMWGLLRVGMVRTAEGKPDHFIAQVIDITEQRRLDRLKSEFVAVVSHELRTPLTAILGALSLLTTYDDDTLPDEAQRLLFIAKTNGDRLHNLINDILDFQKFSAGQMPFSLERHAVATLVEDTLLANLALCDKHGVRFNSSLRERSLSCVVDPKRFHQVMANLLSNAAKFANRGSMIEVAAEKLGPSIRISIKNTGPGIEEAFRDRVFMPFSQESSMSDLRSGGTGLGLSITKQIVEQMGGEIGFESIPNESTVFWFTIRADQ